MSSIVLDARLFVTKHVILLTASSKGRSTCGPSAPGVVHWWTLHSRGAHRWTLHRPPQGWPLVDPPHHGVHGWTSYYRGGPLVDPPLRRGDPLAGQPFQWDVHWGTPPLQRLPSGGPATPGGSTGGHSAPEVVRWWTLRSKG